MTNLVPVADKLGKLLRLLSSDCDGEILATVHAIKRTLESERLDLHALAETIESANGVRKFSEAEALEIFQRGVRKGRDEAEAEHGFHDVERREPDWHDIACTCAASPQRLRPNECEFVEDMVRRTVHGGDLSEKQEKWLRDIFVRVRK
jgi:hypothetical protein